MARRAARTPPPAPTGARRSGSRPASSQPGCPRTARPGRATRRSWLPSKVGIVGRHRRPGLRRAPDDAGAARPEQPLVAAGDEEVAAELVGPAVLDAEPVHAVDAQQRPVGLGAPGVELGQRVGDRPRSAASARARVHPRDGDDARLRRAPRAQARDDLVDGRRWPGRRRAGPCGRSRPVRSARSRSASCVA